MHINQFNIHKLIQLKQLNSLFLVRNTMGKYHVENAFFSRKRNEKPESKKETSQKNKK